MSTDSTVLAMKLLRGIIDYGDKDTTLEALNSNATTLLASKYQWRRDDDEKVFKFIQDFYTAHFEVPTLAIVRDYFDAKNDAEAVERLKDIGTAELHTRNNYVYILRACVDEQTKEEILSLLNDTSKIVTGKVTIKKGAEKIILSGAKDACDFFISKSTPILEDSGLAFVEKCDVRENVKQIMTEEYEEAKNNPDTAFGVFSGIDFIDRTSKGLKRGELWTHAAFPGHLKTSFALTWAYNASTRYKRNVVYCSFEMPFKHLRRIFAVMHSTNAIFRNAGYAPLDYVKVRDGLLSPDEEKFYDIVLDDFENNSSYTKINIWTPSEDYTIANTRRTLEGYFREQDVGMCILDHTGLMEPDKKGSNKDYVVALNSIIRDAKRLALHFHSNTGVPILQLFQTNRKGHDEAAKNNGLYKMDALSYANECEKSSDVITTTFLDDDHRKNGTAMFGCVKVRDSGMIPAGLIGVDYSTRRLYELADRSEDNNIGIDILDSLSLA